MPLRTCHVGGLVKIFIWVQKLTGLDIFDSAFKQNFY